MINAVSSSKPNPNQFNVSLRPELKERLKELAVEFWGKNGKATRAGAEIIETYVERWAIIERQVRQWKDEQEKEMLESIHQQIRRKPPLVKGSASDRWRKRK